MTAAQDGFDVARQIAGWMDGQLKKDALRQIDREERRLKGIKDDENENGDESGGSETHPSESSWTHETTTG